MNILDVIFLFLIGASILYSLVRGLIREIFSFLAIILGFFGASYGYSRAAEWLKGWVGQETFAQILGFAVLFLLLALGVSLLGRLLSKLIHKGGLGWADRMGGGAFGFLKAILLIAIILLVLTAFLPPKSKLILESKISPAALSIARGLSFLVPERFQRLYTQKERELKKYWSFREFPMEKTENKGLKKI
jgi:membrane protein required for colicin V production